MKVAIYLLTFCVAVSCDGDDGSYTPDDSGAYIPTDEGRYIPDDSGKYTPDDSGLYRYDGSGRYIDDGSGRYFDDGSGKYHRETIKKYKYLNTLNSINLVPAGTSLINKFVKPNPPSASSLGGKEIPRYGKYDDNRWKIVRQISNVDADGYHWEYETENDISAEESGKLHNKNTDQEAIKAKGFFKYTGPDRKVYSIAYTADENGFIADGDHLPVGLQRALAKISSKKA